MLEVQCLRVIPFDLGGPITGNGQSLAAEGTLFTLTDIAERHTETLPTGTLECCLFTDGFGVAALLEKPSVYKAINNFDTVQFLEHECTRYDSLILNRCDESKHLQQRISRWRTRIKSKISRLSASSQWEYGGLSYFLSVYFINTKDPLCKLTHDEQQHIRDATKLILMYGESDMLRYICQKSSIEEIIKRETSLDDPTEVDYDLHPDISAYMSWEAIAVVGAIDEAIIDDYKTLEVKLQHSWFSIYVYDQIVTDVLSNLETGGLRTDVKTLELLRVDALLKISEFRAVLLGGGTSRYLRLLEGVRHTSLVEKNIEELERKLELAREIILREQARIQEVISRKIEVGVASLTVITLLQALFVDLPGLSRSSGFNSFQFIGFAISLLTLIVVAALLR
jgi:hypothetical protein